VRRERPTLRGQRFFTASAIKPDGIPDTSWFDETGNEMTPERWSFAEGRLLALRRIARSDDTRPDRYAASLLLLNAFSEDREFVLPAPVVPWQVAIDAAEPFERTGLQAHGKRQPHNNRITVAAHSAVLLVADDVRF